MTGLPINLEGEGECPLSRSEAEAFVKVCNYFFEQIPEPEGDVPISLVLELEDAESTQQVCFLRWPKQTVPGTEEAIPGDG